MTIKPCGCDTRYVDERKGHAPECVHFVPSKRGFASWTPEMRREVSARGGKAAHASGKAHEFTSEEAREAGRKAGIATHAKLRAGKAVAT